VRLSEHAAQLIHDNVIVGKTSVVVDGTWTRPQAELDRGKLLRQLRRHEGKSNKVYADSLGIPTIGIGFNLKRSRAQELIANLGADYAKILSGTEQLDDRQVNELFNADIEESIENCKSMFPNFSQLSDVRQRVLVDMMFNLGPDRLGAFKNLRAALEQLDFDQAANEMEHSVWYRQVKLRGKTLAAMMRTDADP
jgi:lysozyme